MTSPEYALLVWDQRREASLWVYRPEKDDIGWCGTSFANFRWRQAGFALEQAAERVGSWYPTAWPTSSMLRSAPSGTDTQTWIAENYPCENPVARMEHAGLTSRAILHHRNVARLGFTIVTHSRLAS
jgi:hypothetical protein